MKRKAKEEFKKTVQRNASEIAFLWYAIAIAVATIFISFSIHAHAAPFLSADPQTGTPVYRMRLSNDNGQTWSDWVEGDAVNDRLLFDLAPVPPDNYRGEAQAGGTYEVTDTVTGITTSAHVWSESAPFVLSVRIGSTPTNLEVVEAPF